MGRFRLTAGAAYFRLTSQPSILSFVRPPPPRCRITYGCHGDRLRTTVVVAGYSLGGVRFFHARNGTELGSADTGSGAVLAVKRGGQVNAKPSEGWGYVFTTAVSNLPIEGVCWDAGWGAARTDKRRQQRGGFTFREKMGCFGICRGGTCVSIVTNFLKGRTNAVRGWRLSHGSWGQTCMQALSQCLRCRSLMRPVRMAPRAVQQSSQPPRYD